MTIIPEEGDAKKEDKKIKMSSQPLNQLNLIFSLLGFLIGLFGTKKSL